MVYTKNNSEQNILLIELHQKKIRLTSYKFYITQNH